MEQVFVACLILNLDLCWFQTLTVIPSINNGLFQYTQVTTGIAHSHKLLHCPSALFIYSPLRFILLWMLFNNAINFWDCIVSVMDEWYTAQRWFNATDRGRLSNRSRSCSSATFSIINLEWTGLGSNLGFRNERTAINSLTHGTTFVHVPSTFQVSLN